MRRRCTWYERSGFSAFSGIERPSMPKARSGNAYDFNGNKKGWTKGAKGGSGASMSASAYKGGKKSKTKRAHMDIELHGLLVKARRQGKSVQLDVQKSLDSDSSDDWSAFGSNYVFS
jgi:hypothetical protein